VAREPESERRNALPIAADAVDDEAPGLGGRRAEAIHRLQIGLAGIATVLLLVALASVIQKRAIETEQSAVPEAAPTVEPKDDAPLVDPLADAGVVPDLPAEAAAEAEEARRAEGSGDGTRAVKGDKRQ